MVGVFANGARTSCPPACAARSFMGKNPFLEVVRATRSGGQDVRAPFPLERLAAAESGLDVMPPFELIAFIGLPTEQHDAAVSHRWEINQPL